MKTLPLTETKAKLSALIDGLAADDEGVVITRNGVAAAILVSPDEFERWTETLALRLDNENMSEIRTALDQLEGGKAEFYTLEELFGDSPAQPLSGQPTTDGV